MAEEDRPREDDRGDDARQGAEAAGATADVASGSPRAGPAIAAAAQPDELDGYCVTGPGPSDRPRLAWTARRAAPDQYLIDVSFGGTAQHAFGPLPAHAVTGFIAAREAEARNLYESTLRRFEHRAPPPPARDASSALWAPLSTATAPSPPEPAEPAAAAIAPALDQPVTEAAPAPDPGASPDASPAPGHRDGPPRATQDPEAAIRAAAIADLVGAPAEPAHPDLPRGDLLARLERLREAKRAHGAATPRRPPPRPGALAAILPPASTIISGSAPPPLRQEAEPTGPAGDTPDRFNGDTAPASNQAFASADASDPAPADEVKPSTIEAPAADSVSSLAADALPPSTAAATEQPSPPPAGAILDPAPRDTEAPQAAPRRSPQGLVPARLLSVVGSVGARTIGMLRARAVPAAPSPAPATAPAPAAAAPIAIPPLPEGLLARIEAPAAAPEQRHDEAPQQNPVVGEAGIAAEPIAEPVKAFDSDDEDVALRAIADFLSKQA